MTDGSIDWTERRLDGESAVLVGQTRQGWCVLAPPACPVTYDESSAKTTCWRLAEWFAHEDDPPLLGFDEPDRVESLDSRQALELLPAARRPFVAEALAQQIRRAALLGGPAADGTISEARARSAGRARAWAHRELRSAFPEDDWFTARLLQYEVPATVEELLRMSEVGDRRRPRQSAPLRARLQDFVKRNTSMPFGTRIATKLEMFRYSLVLYLLPSCEEELRPEINAGRELLRATGEIHPPYND